MTSDPTVGAQTALDTYSADRYWPSKTNCTSEVREPETDESVFEDLSPDECWQRKNEIVDRFVEERPGRAARPISVRGGTKLRDESAQEKYTGEEDEKRYRSKTWSSVLNEFLDWYNGYRDVELVYASPDGEEVRSDMENSHMPHYGDRYDARTKAFECQIVWEYDDPDSVMLTFSGSSKNANGGWRCPADHLRDVIESRRLKRGRGVYHVL
jgi:hypothetical protein